MSDFTLRPHRKGDEFSVNESFNRAFGLQRTLQEWRWKYRTEEQGSRIVLGVNAGREVVAHYAALCCELQVDGAVLLAGHTVDVFCLRQPDAVLTRLYLKAAREFFRLYGGGEGFSLLYGFPGPIPLRLGQLKLGYSAPAKVSLWRSRASRWSFRRLRYEVQTDCDVNLIELLWRDSAHRYQVAVIRNGLWVQRRYLSHPHKKYLHLTMMANGYPHCWAALLVQGGVCSLVDLLWNGKDPIALVDLDQAAKATARAHGAKRLEMWLEGDSQAAEILSDRGWTETVNPLPLGLVVRPFDQSLEVPAFLSRFYLTMGVADLI